MTAVVLMGMKATLVLALSDVPTWLACLSQATGCALWFIAQCHYHCRPAAGDLAKRHARKCRTRTSPWPARDNLNVGDEPKPSFQLGKTCRDIVSKLRASVSCRTITNPSSAYYPADVAVFSLKT